MDLQNIIDNVKFVNENYAIILPFVLIIIDILSGVINAVIKGEIDSSVMRSGLGHKFSEIVYIVLGILADVFFGWHSVYLLSIFYISLMEIVSILENSSKLGLPIPEAIKNILKIKE